MVSEGSCVRPPNPFSLRSSNMYSHVLAAYQKSLLVFWEKTAKTMAAVADSFTGYQYYEFTVIKDLTEPSRLLAEKNSNPSSTKAPSKEKASKVPPGDESLIDISEAAGRQPAPDQMLSLIDEPTNKLDLNEPFSALIDISDAQLDDQLIELEKLTTLDHMASASSHGKSTATKSSSDDNLVELSTSTAEYDKIFSDLLNTTDSNSADASWMGAFGQSSNQKQAPVSNIPSDAAASSKSNSFLPSSLLSELLTSMNKMNKSTPPPAAAPKSKSTTATAEKSNWLNLFAELDPLQNPDAIGKAAGDEADRSC